MSVSKRESERKDVTMATSPTRPEPPRPVEAVRGLDDLSRAFLSLRSGDEVKRFLRDLCTLSELEALAHRWEIARLLEQELPYLDVAERAGGSTATVTRVAQWLRHGAGGYRIALDRMARGRRRAR